MNNRVSLPKYCHALILMLACVTFIVISQIGNVSIAKALYSYDTLDLRLVRYWQGLNKPYWVDWTVDYSLKLLETHDSLYQSTQRSGKGGYFKNDSIKIRPLIIWFVHNDGSTSKPLVVKSSGCLKYDLFYCNVIEKTKAPVFPERRNRIFMWDGETSEVVQYLKYKGVLPMDYQINNTTSPYQFNWEKI